MAPTTEANPDSWRTIDAVGTSIRVLEALRDLDGAGVTELAAELDASKAGIHSHLATLRANEFVTKDGEEYRLSLRFLDLGEYVKKSVPAYEVVREQVDLLADQTGELAQFMVEEHGWGIYIHKARGENAVQTASYVGNRKRLHCTGVGKAILASLPDERVESIIDRRGLPAHTEGTITQPDALFAELEEVRERGVAFDDEEILPGLRCVAIPVETTEGRLIGALSVAGPTSRMKGDRLYDDLPEVVADTATVIQVNGAQA